MSGQSASGARRRGFGVAAGLDPAVAGRLAERCAELGYSSLWSNDHPGALGLETLAAFAEAAPELELGVAVMALDRHSPDEIATHIDRLGLDRDRLWLGVGAGFSERPLTRMSEALPELRAALGGIRLVLAAMGPRMCRLAGSAFDGAFFNWMTPAFAASAGARRRGRGFERSARPAADLRLRAHRGRPRRRGAARQGGVVLPRSPRRLPEPLLAPRGAARARSVSPRRTPRRCSRRSRPTRRST